ncbi:LOW QUALITY PROTEIN: uncharacterized protein RBU57_013031 [Macrochelys suwanniensis]
MSNQTTVIEFLLLGFSDVRELQILHFVVFLVIYLAGLIGNLLIISAIALNHHLHTPMYFFLVNLSILDLGSISVTIPKSMANSLMNTSVISYPGCVTQVFLFVVFGSSDFVLLTIMAYDRQVAICQPLHYEREMNKKACVEMAASAWITGIVYSALHTGNTFRLPFCQSNVINQFFCEIPQLLKLTCSNSYLSEVGLLVFSLFLGFNCFVFIIVSYVQVFKAVLRIPSEQGRRKTFSTCLPHLTVVSLLVCTSFFAYLKPTSSSSSGLDLIVGVLYSLVPPVMNPIIYSMRNKEIKAALKKLIELQIFHFVVFLMIYLAGLMGNFLNISAVVLDHHLHSPISFFLVNLSILDLGSISVTIPKSMANSLMKTRSIFYPKMSNRTTVTEFLLLGFSDVQELQILHFVMFLVIYLTGLMGNLLIITAVALDHHLHPMYFFLMNLSILDLGSMSVTIPKSMTNSLMNTRVISYPGCVTQVFLFLVFTTADLALLTIMAYDRHVAICQPLHYERVMNRRPCVQMVPSAWITGIVHSSLHTGNTFRLPFCQSNVINQFFCEIPQLLKLTCSDSYLSELGATAFSVFLGSNFFVFIIVSYVQIFKAVLRIPSEQGQRKAFSSCLPHLTVVSLFLSTGFFAYLKPAFSSASGLDLMMGVLYSLLPPVMNPIIYSMRNKEIKAALKKLIVWRLFTKN